MPGRALRRRLDRLAEAARRRVWDRQRLRDNAAAWAAIAPALAAARIDPASIGALHGLAGAADALARLGDGPELQHADAEFAAADSRPARGEGWTARATARAPAFAGKKPPDRGAALVDWYAWALAHRPPPER